MTLPAELDFLLRRRSTAALEEPGPTHDELSRILEAAMTVPDHGQLKPYRFVVVEGEGRAHFGDALAAAALEARADLPPGLVDKVRQKAFAAPTLLVILASPRADVKIPEWEQICSASCTGFAMALAAHALGLGAIWKTANALEGASLRALFAMTPHERILGWINVGRRRNVSEPPRAPSDPKSVTRVLRTGSLEPF